MALDSARLSILSGAEPPRIERVSRAVATGEGIKNLILTRGLRPGDPLPSEQVLIDALGVSRSSVREAVRHLQALDIVTVKQGSGTFVGDLSLDPLVESLAFRAQLNAGASRSTLAEVIDVRHLLDTGTAPHVCAALEGTDQPELAHLVDEMITRAEAGRLFSDLDFAFHDTLLAAAGNEVVHQLVNSLWSVHQIVVPRVSTRLVTLRLAATAHSHGDMLAAACAGDVVAYTRAVDAHYAPIRAVLAEAGDETEA